MPQNEFYDFAVSRSFREFEASELGIPYDYLKFARLPSWEKREILEAWERGEDISNPEFTLINERLAELEMRDRESLPTTIKAQLRYALKKIKELDAKKPKVGYE